MIAILGRSWLIAWLAQFFRPEYVGLLGVVPVILGIRGLFDLSLLQAAAVYVPLPQEVLDTVPLTPADWGVIAACSLAPVAVVELVKAVQRRFRTSANRHDASGE